MSSSNIPDSTTSGDGPISSNVVDSTTRVGDDFPECLWDINILKYVCQQIMHYRNTGEMPSISLEEAFGVLQLSKMYHLEDVAQVCLEYLHQSIDIESVSQILLQADQHGETVLKEQCADYITDNVSQVMATDGWAQLTQLKVELVLDLFRLLANKTNR